MAEPALDEPGPASGAAGHPEFVAVARLSDVPAGWVLKVRVGPHELALANCDGTVHALANACTHAGGPLGDSRLQEGCLLECPWHGAAFDARTGQPRRGPARKPLRPYPVKIENDVILVARPA
jgi:nitrite reductase/ring-hydroxylating ferredoxin subunit